MWNSRLYFIFLNDGKVNLIKTLIPNCFDERDTVGRRVSKPDVEIITEHIVPWKKSKLLKNHKNKCIFTNEDKHDEKAVFCEWAWFQKLSLKWQSGTWDFFFFILVKYTSFNIYHFNHNLMILNMFTVLWTIIYMPQIFHLPLKKRFY